MKVARITAATALLFAGMAVQAIPANAATVTVTSTSPTTLPQGATYQDFTVNGSGFNAGAVVSFTQGVTVQSSRFQSATKIIVNISVSSNATIGADTVTVTDSGGVGTGMCTTCFAISDKPVFSFTETLPDGAANQDIFLFGSGFMPAATAGAGTGVTVNDVFYTSPTELTVQVTVSSTATLGTRTLTVINHGSGGATSGSCSACLTISNTPTVFTFGSLPQGAANQELSLFGGPFIPGATASATGTGVTVNNVIYLDPSDLKLNVTVSLTATQATRTITVVNHINGTSPSGSCASCLHISDVPTFGTSASLPQGASNQKLSLSGSDFMPGATATGGTGVTVNSVEYTSPSSLAVYVTITSSATIGSHTLTVVNHANSTTYSGTGSFTVSNTPAGLSTFTASLPQGAAQQTVFIFGEDFIPGATVAFPPGSGVTVNTVQFENSAFGTYLQVNLSVAATAPQATLNFNVINHANSTTYVGTCTGCLTISDIPHFPFNGTAYEPRSTAHVDVSFFGTDFMPGVTATLTLPGSTGSGGVIINAVSYENPGQVILNVSVTSTAAIGARTLTLVNHANSTTYSNVNYTAFVVGTAPT